MKNSSSFQKIFNTGIENSDNRLFVKVASFFVTVIIMFICNVGYTQNFKLVQSGPSVSNPGETVTYIIAVKNMGATVSDAIITAYLPSSNLYTYISSYPVGEFDAEKNLVRWNNTNNLSLTSFAGGEIYFKVTIKIGTQTLGEYKVPEQLSKLKLYTTLESGQYKIVIKSNEIITEVPKAGGAVLPVE